MKNVLVCAALAAIGLSLAAPSAHAVSAYGIWWMPSEGDDDGWGFGAKEKRGFTPLLSYDLRASYVSFSSPDAGIIPLEGTIMANFGMLYGGIGGGYYFFTGDNSLDDTFGWYLLVGLELLPGPVSVFGEAKWQKLESDIGGGAKADLNAFVLHAGVTMNLRR